MYSRHSLSFRFLRVNCKMYQVASSEYWILERIFLRNLEMGERSKLVKQDNALLFFASMCGRLIPVGRLVSR